MAKYMVTASYSAEGARGLIKEGGKARVSAVTKLVEGLGGKIEAFYFAYGANDAIIILDVPDTATGVALSLAVNSSGAVQLTSMPLITADEMDAACKKTVSYKAPGA